MHVRLRPSLLALSPFHLTTVLFLSKQTSTICPLLKAFVGCRSASVIRDTDDHPRSLFSPSRPLAPSGLLLGIARYYSCIVSYRIARPIFRPNQQAARHLSKSYMAFIF